MSQPIQLSGSAIIDDGKLLLLWKNKNQRYEFPGGKVEAGETLEQGALRETKEEIGCDVTLIKYLGYKEFHIEGRDFQSHKFLATINSGQTARVNEPDIFSEIFYLPMHDYANYAVAPNVREFCEDYKQGKIDLS